MTEYRFYMQTDSLIRRLRDAVAGRFLTRIKRATHRMPVVLRTIERHRVLVVASHMDDEVIPCGGVLLLHHELGSEVGVVFVSDSGGPDAPEEHRAELAAIRRREAAAAAERTGHRIISCMGLPDSHLPSRENDIRSHLIPILKSFRPEQVFCPFPTDGHGDHQATAMGVAAALTETKYTGEVWAYEVWTPLWPNTNVDITRVAEEKRKVIELYASQTEERDYASAILGLNRYRGLRSQVEYAEAYYVCDAPHYRQHVAELNRI